MGLDSWINAIPKSAVTVNEASDVNNKLDIAESPNIVELAYWRNNDSIHETMRQLHCKKFGAIRAGDYNCVNTPLTLEDIQTCIEDIKNDSTGGRSLYEDFSKEDRSYAVRELKKVQTYMKKKSNADKVIYYGGWW